MVKITANGKYSADAWGYSLKSNDAPIKGIFQIKKDTSDRIRRLTQTETAHHICEQVFSITGRICLDDVNQELFLKVADMARSIPGFELHFRKSPDFWKLIEAELPVG